LYNLNIFAIPGIERFKNSTELMKMLTDKGARCYRAEQTPILQDAVVSGPYSEEQDKSSL